LGVMSALALFPWANVRIRQMDDIIEEIEAQGRDSRFRATLSSAGPPRRACCNMASLNEDFIEFYKH
jgi:hypothetical protein